MLHILRKNKDAETKGEHAEYLSLGGTCVPSVKGARLALRLVLRISSLEITKRAVVAHPLLCLTSVRIV